MAAKKKAAGKRAAKKTAAPKIKKQAATKKKAAPKKAAATQKKVGAKKKTAAPKKKAAKPKAEKSPSAQKTASASISTMDVNLGHVFSLRPRVNSSFRQNDFFAAKRGLREESFASIPDAARAVAEEALALTRGDAAGADSKRHRRSSNPARNL